MYGDNERDKLRTLGTMAVAAMEKNFCNRVAARETLAEFIRTDKRFDQYDPDILARRVEECRSNGAKLDFDDPRLKGQAPRPLERDHWQY